MSMPVLKWLSPAIAIAASACSPPQGEAPSRARSALVFGDPEKLLWVDQGAHDIVGSAVAIAGDVLAIGAPGWPGDPRSKVALFTRTGGTWAPLPSISPKDSASSPYFGQALAMTSDTLVVGAADGTLPSPVHVFTPAQPTWELAAELYPEGLPADAYFGRSVAISSDTMLIGAPALNATGPGAVYVFARKSGVWGLQATLTAEDGQDGHQLGGAVAIDGDTAIAGATRADAGRGAAYVWRRTGATWQPEGALLAGGVAVGDRFGQVVAISGDTAVVNATHLDVGTMTTIGRAYVFQRAGGAWGPPKEIERGSAVVSAALSQGTLVLGAMHDDVLGCAVVYQGGGGVFAEDAVLSAPVSGSMDMFGASVSFSSGTFLVGAPGDAERGEASGAAYVFEGRLPNGAPCGAGAACASSRCIDEVCCEGPCEAPLACSALRKGGGEDGVCGAVADAGRGGSGGALTTSGGGAGAPARGTADNETETSYYGCQSSGPARSPAVVIATLALAALARRRRPDREDT